MPLDVSPFSNAVQRLRDGLIPRFEFTYELSHRMLRRYLQDILPSAEDAARMTFAELVRAGNERGLLRAEWPAWRRFRDIRTRTTRTYNADTASEVVREIAPFLAEAEHLCAELRKRVG
jgi:nucleotidyltransferase substrate binding protein (TIGR01987 family)